MHIDRTRFLFLTASIAGGSLAGACSATPSPDAGTQPAPDPASTGDVVVVPPDDSAEPLASAEPHDKPPSETPADGCDDDSASVPACSVTAPPGSYCEGLSDVVDACRRFHTAFRPRISERAVSCLNQSSGHASVCDYRLPGLCALQAVRAACVKPSTFGQCSTLMAQCAGKSWSTLKIEECQQLLSSVRDGKRQEAIACMTEGCTLDSCWWQLR